MYSHEDICVLWELTQENEESNSNGNAPLDSNPARLSELIERVQSSGYGSVSFETWCEFFKHLDVDLKVGFISWHQSSSAGLYKKSIKHNEDAKVLPQFLFEVLLEENNNSISSHLAARAGITPEAVKFLLARGDKETLNLLSHNEWTPPHSLDTILKKLKEEPHLKPLAESISEGLVAHPNITKNIIQHYSLHPAKLGGQLNDITDCVNYINATRGELFRYETYLHLLKNDKLGTEMLTEQMGIAREFVVFYEKLTTKSEQERFTEKVGFNPQVIQLDIITNDNYPIHMVREYIDIESAKMLKNEHWYRDLHEVKYEAFGRLLTNDKLTTHDIERYHSSLKDSGNISAKLGFLRNSNTPISVVGDILEQLKSKKPEPASIVRRFLTSLAITMAEEKIKEKGMGP